MRTLFLTKCCRKYPLRFGCKVAGWYSLITSVFGIFNGFNMFFDLTTTLQYQYLEVAAELTKLKILFCLFDAVLSGFLLMSLRLKRPNNYLYWIIAKSMLLLCEIPLYFMMSNFDKLGTGLAVFLLLLGVDIYCVLVVHGHWMEGTKVPIPERESEV